MIISKYSMITLKCLVDYLDSIGDNYSSDYDDIVNSIHSSIFAIGCKHLPSHLLSIDDMIEYIRNYKGV